MTFFLNNSKINVLNGATFSIKKDETLDSGKIELIFSEDKTPIKPMTDLRIEDNGETYNFVVLSDVVSVASKKPITYKHTIEYAQNTKKLSKIQVRNTQFSQPAKNSLKCGINKVFDNEDNGGYMYDFNNIDGNGYTYSMQISNRHQVKNSYFKFDFYYAKCLVEGTTNQNTLQETCPTLNVSFDVYKDGELLFTRSGSFNNGDISYYYANLTDGTYTIKNLKIKRLINTTYSDFDLFIVNVSLVADVYYYSLYDVLDTLRKQIALKEDNKSYSYAYALPTSGDFYDTLKNTIAPNLTFTQCNLFECLSQIYMYLDGYPILTKDNVLDIRYFNDNNGIQVKNSPSDIKTAMSEERFVNGLITDFQNAELNNVLVFPSKKTYSTIQSKNIGIVATTDYIMRVDKPIYKLRNVKVKVDTFTLQYDSMAWLITFNGLLDITNNVVEEDIYINLETNIDTTVLTKFDLYRENCLHYKQKSREIEVGETFKSFITNQYVMPYVVKSSLSKFTGHEFGGLASSISPDFTDVKSQLKYQIEYETLTNGRLLIEGVENKYQGAERLDIGQGGADIMKTGLNLLGTTIKTGVDTLIRTEKFSKTEDRIKVGAIYYENGDKYIATKVDECVFGDFVFSTIEYTKNFNKLSQFIAIDQKKRFNEIDSSLTLRSEDIFKEYLYFSLDTITNGDVIHINRKLIVDGLTETFELNPKNETKIDFATCETSNFDGSSNGAFGKVWLPMVQYGSGNALCFEMGFDSPINANSNFQYNETLNAWYSKYILYTANDGFADNFNINFYYQKYDTETDDLPQVNDTMIGNATLLGGFANLEYYKKPNEIFALNYELLCLSYQNQEIFIGEHFIKYNGIIANAIPKQELRLYISDTELYSILDKYAVGSQVSGTFTISVIQSDTGLYTAKIYKGGSLYQLDKKIKSWALCDQNNNIYISANQDLAINDNLIFYIKTSRERL